MQQGITMARRGGTVCIIGLYTADQQIDARVGLRKELTITWANSYGLWHGRSEYDIALEMLASQKLRAETIITHRFALDQIGVAFAAAEDKANSGATKVLVLPNS
jgi:threonine dehydrogenase-like Zn-dependent dehydrogenase